MGLDVNVTFDELLRGAVRIYERAERKARELAEREERLSARESALREREDNVREREIAQVGLDKAAEAARQSWLKSQRKADDEFAKATLERYELHKKAKDLELMWDAMRQPRMGDLPIGEA